MSRPHFWVQTHEARAKLGLASATIQCVDVEGVILCHVCVGDLCVKILFGEVKILSVPVLLSTSFIERFVLAIFPLKPRLVPENSRPAAILLTFTGALNVTLDAKHSEESEEVEEGNIPRVTKAKQIPAKIQTTILVRPEDTA